MTFQSIIPQSSGLFEKTLEEVFGTEIEKIDADAIKNFWNPDLCPAEHLSVLAHALSVDLWDDRWDEMKRRSVIRRWVSLEFLKGTYPGLKAFVEIAGGEVKQTIVPPGGFFLGRPLTEDEWDAYVDANPRVRIQMARRQDQDANGVFIEDDFYDDRWLTPDIGPALYGRRAVLRLTKTSPDIDLQIIQITTTDVTGTYVEFERVVYPAETPVAFAIDDGFYDDTYLEADDTGERIYTFSLDGSYVHRVSEARLNTVLPGFEPRDATYYRESETGHAGFGFYSDGVMADDCFWLPDAGDEMMADVLYLHNPAVDAPQTGDAGYLDDGYYDLPRYRAEIRVQVPEFAEADSFFCDDGFVDGGSFVPEDPSLRDAVIAAINAVKSKRDQTLVTFQNYRPPVLGDSFSLGTGIRLDTPVPYSL